MLSPLMRYSAVVSKIKAKERNRLKKDDYEAMASMTSVAEVIGYLKENSSFSLYLEEVSEKDTHRGQMEKLLRRAIRDDFCRLYRFVAGKERKFLDIFLVYFELEIMKQILYQIFGGEPEDFEPIIVDDFFERHTSVPFGKLTRATTRAEYAEALQGTPFYELLAEPLKSGTLFDIAMRLDLYYYREEERLIEALPKSDQAAVKEIFAVRVDLLNLMWIYRLKASYRATPDQIKGYLIPAFGRLGKRTIDALAEAESVEAFVRLADESAYRGLFRAPDEGGLERAFSEVLYKAEKKMLREQPMSLAAITAAHQLKEFEMQNIITVVEGVRYRLSPSTILERLVI